MACDITSEELRNFEMMTEVQQNLILDALELQRNLLTMQIDNLETELDCVEYSDVTKSSITRKRKLKPSKDMSFNYTCQKRNSLYNKVDDK